MLGLLCAAVVLSGADAAGTKSTAEERVKAATVAPPGPKECAAEDKEALAKRIAAEQLHSAFREATALTIQSAEAVANGFWDMREQKVLDSLATRIKRFETWPGRWTDTGFARLERLAYLAGGADFVPHDLCKGAASSTDAFCAQVNDPVFTPFCMTWLDIRRGKPAGPGLCARFPKVQHKACRTFFGGAPDECEAATGTEKSWCTFIGDIVQDDLPNCRDPLDPSACFRDLLLAGVRPGSKPCDVLQGRSGRVHSAMAHLVAQCRAIYAGRPLDCPADPSQDTAQAFEPLEVMVDVALRGGSRGVQPVVGMVAWWEAPGGALFGKETSDEVQAKAAVLCAARVTVRDGAGGQLRRWATATGKTRRILRALGESLPSRTDPMEHTADAAAMCVPTAPWMGAGGETP